MLAESLVALVASVARRTRGRHSPDQVPPFGRLNRLGRNPNARHDPW